MLDIVITGVAVALGVGLLLLIRHDRKRVRDVQQGLDRAGARRHVRIDPTAAAGDEDPFTPGRRRVDERDRFISDRWDRLS